MKKIFFATSLLIFTNIAYAGWACQAWQQYPKNHDSILFDAVDSSWSDGLQDLFTCGVTIADIDSRGLLVWAIYAERLATTHFLLDHGANVNSNVYGELKLNLLRSAILNIKSSNDSWYQVSEKIIRAGLSKDQLSEAMNTSLDQLPELLPALTDLIIQHGADVNTPDAWGHYPLAVLAGGYDWANFQYQVHYSKMPNLQEKQMINDNYLHVLTSLLNAGANPNLDSGILYSMAMDWRIPELQLILSKGADANALIFEPKRTVFAAMAAQANEYDCGTTYTGAYYLERLELLLNAGANPNLFYPEKFLCPKLHELMAKYGYVK